MTGHLSTTRGLSLRQLLPVVATLTFAISTALVVLAGAWGGTLGYDYLAYDAAARRLLAGAPLYDTSYEVAGGFGLYYYPPPFALVVLPLAALVPADLAVWLWTVALVTLLLVGIALMPVSATTRWLTLALAGISWPVVQSIKLGQVGPLLLLLFAIGWRSLASDQVVGTVAALGTLVKLHPALLFGWALLRRRWWAIGIGVAAGVALSTLTTPIVGIRAWSDFALVLTRVSDPITIPGNATVGALAFRAGLERGMALLLQVLTMGGVLLIWLLVCLRRPPLVGYLATIVASQLLSPTLWDHYGIFVLLPVAWLLDRRRWWAGLLLLAAPWPLVGAVPLVVYPTVLLVTLGVLLVVGRAPGPQVGRAAPAPETQ